MKLRCIACSQPIADGHEDHCGLCDTEPLCPACREEHVCAEEEAEPPTGEVELSPLEGDELDDPIWDDGPLFPDPLV